METVYDLIVIGSGPGGYVGAIRAAQLGLKVAVVEKDSTFGGTCLNVGCIPSKALLESSEHFAAAKHDFAGHGIKLSNVELDLPTMLGRKNKIVKDLTQGIAFLFKKNKIDSYTGWGRIESSNGSDAKIEVKSADGQKKTLQTKNVMLAMGSSPMELPFLKFDENRVVSSTGALALTSVPKKLAIIGGGVIGLELGSVWNRLGSEVTVLEFSDRICPAMDVGTIQVYQKSLQKQGFKILTKTKVIGADKTVTGITLKYESLEGKSDELTADAVLVAIGRRPYFENSGIQELGIEQDKAGRVLINEKFQTKFKNIYAVGDLIAGPMLAHKAEEEGVAVAEIIAGHHGHVNYNTVPGVVYTWPEVASVGLTEEQLKEQAIPYLSGSFPFMANGRAKALGFTDGQVKILAHKDTDKILGVHIVGPRASELISEAVIAMEFGGSSEDLARSFHAHPTLSEVVREAALAVDKRARQM